MSFYGPGPGSRGSSSGGGPPRRGNNKRYNPDPESRPNKRRFGGGGRGDDRRGGRRFDGGEGRGRFLPPRRDNESHFNNRERTATAKANQNFRHNPAGGNTVTNPVISFQDDGDNNVTTKDELTQREINLHMLQSINQHHIEVVSNDDVRPIDVRRKKFQELCRMDQISMFLPDDVPYDSLPGLDPPVDWDEQQQATVKKLRDEVEKLLPEDSEGDNDDDDDSDEDSREGPGANVPSDKYRNSGVHFLESLPYCPSMTLGFLVLTLPYHMGDNQYCYCPCCNVQCMRRWRDVTRTEDFLSDAICDPGSGSRGAAPAAFWSHLESKVQGGCKKHAVIKLYLKQLFQDYHAPGIQHIGLEKLNTKEYRKAQRFVMKEVKTQMNFLEKEAEVKRKLEKQLGEAQEQMTKLRETNKDYANKLDAQEKLKLQFNAQDSKEVELTSDREKIVYDKFCQFRENAHQLLVQSKVPPKVTLHIDVDFDLNNVMQDWYNSFFVTKGAVNSEEISNYGFLFAKLALPPTQDDDSDDNRHIIKNIAKQRRQAVESWTVDFATGQCTQYETQVRKATKIKAIGKDEGGPTRQFFSSVWTQIGDLSISTVQSEKGKVPLFDKGERGFVPLEDDRIHKAIKDMLTTKKNDQKTDEVGTNGESKATEGEGKEIKTVDQVKPDDRATGKIVGDDVTPKAGMDKHIPKKKEKTAEDKSTEQSEPLRRDEKTAKDKTIEQSEPVKKDEKTPKDKTTELSEPIKEDEETLKDNTTEQIETKKIEAKKLQHAERKTLDQVKAYYRATGRMFAHSMLLSKKNSGPLTIATHIFPNLYKNIIFRGLDVMSPQYPLGVLIDDCAELFDLYENGRYKQGEPLEKILRDFLFIEETENSGKTLREQVYEQLVDSRSIALESIGEGLTLGGAVCWTGILATVPTKSLEKFIFGHATISEEQVFDTDGNLRLFEIVQDYENGDDSAVHAEVQARFFEKFKGFIRKKLTEDPRYLSQLVSFATGYTYIPNTNLDKEKNKFVIKIEMATFHFGPDHLPAAHTCVNTLKIPAKAYEADIDVFEKKLSKSMAQTLGRFDME